MTPDGLLDLLRNSPSLGTLATKWFVEGVPWIFKGDRSLYTRWRNEAAEAAGLPADAVYLAGSAVTGYSLSPLKAARPFKPVVAGERTPSDIDLAIIDSSLFTLAWDDLIHSDRRGRLLGIANDVGLRQEDDLLGKIRRDVYHGAIGDRLAARAPDPAARLRSVLAATTRYGPFRGHVAKARVYRRREDFVAYHEQSLRQLRRALEEQ
jgi:hypothetical protein